MTIYVLCKFRHCFEAYGCPKPLLNNSNFSLWIRKTPQSLHYAKNKQTKKPNIISSALLHKEAFEHIVDPPVI